MAITYQSHDLVTSIAEYEVKSTLSRYERTIHVSGQYQLQKSRERLYLFFCRFEENENGFSINDYTEKIVGCGVYRDVMEQKLCFLGYRHGNSYRDIRYFLHEAMIYEVDDRFPKITPESMKGDSFPAGISHLSYDVNLTTLNGTVIPLNDIQ